MRSEKVSEMIKRLVDVRNFFNGSKYKISKRIPFVIIEQRPKNSVTVDKESIDLAFSCEKKNKQKRKYIRLDVCQK